MKMTLSVIALLQNSGNQVCIVARVGHATYLYGISQFKKRYGFMPAMKLLVWHTVRATPSHF